ncbi:MAG TPA: hypothetical protein VLB80_00680 [Candidatus Babeliales bacterium]|nr:hypothetical protein [Candidatus Babeliales bacterium]
MKKQSVLFAVLLVVVPGLYGATSIDVNSRLLQSARSLENKEYGINQVEFNPSLFNNWFDTFAMAREFIIDNSKNLIGIKDSSIINALSHIELVNKTLFTNIVRIIRESSNLEEIKNQINRIDNLRNNLTKEIINLRKGQMTLSNKREATNVLFTLEGILNKIMTSIANAARTKLRLQ